MLKAVVFDVDGTLADTERDGHRRAFNRAFAEYGLPYRWDVEIYGRLLAVTGGRRRIEGYLASRGHRDADELAAAVHRAKTAHFVEWVRSGPVECRPGVRGLISELADEGVRVGVATTGSRAWVEVLLERLFGLDVFSVIVTGDDVPHLKPSPDVYLTALRQLDVPGNEVLAVEDSEPGLAAARAGRLSCLVVTNDYTSGGRFDGAVAVRQGFDGVGVETCRALVDRRRT
jgi:HAD superfamily hydrolase (TIGR01509 family)